MRPPALTRIREWARYRRYLAVLLRDEPGPVTPGRRAQLEDMARRAARIVGRHRKDD